MRKDSRPKKLLDFIESTTKDFGATLGLVDDSIPPVGSVAYGKIKVNKHLDEDCISMRNEPIDPLETVEDMQFDMSMIDGLGANDARSSMDVGAGGVMRQ